MRQIKSWSILCLAAMLVIGVSSCCLNCSKESKEVKSASVADTAEPLSGEIVDGVRVIKITAKQYEFTPAVIRVNQGEKVQLELTSSDVTHGFKLKEYDIDRKLPPGQTQTVAFVADKSGKFNFHCSVICGVGHLGMKGTLIVEPK